MQPLYQSDPSKTRAVIHILIFDDISVNILQLENFYFIFMKQNNIVKIKKLAIRDIWRREEDFTRWLEKNVDSLNEVLGFDINIISREEKVGPFKVDLYGEDKSGSKVIIENQFEETDHTHLGQVLTYLTNFDLLYKMKKKIDKDFGEKLVWDRMDENVTSNIKCQLDGVDVFEEADWSKMNKFMIDKGIRMQKIFREVVQNIRNK